MNKPLPQIPPKWITEKFRVTISDPFQILLFDFKRFVAINEALRRYRSAYYPYPAEWIMEKHDIKYNKLYSSVAIN